MARPHLAGICRVGVGVAAIGALRPVPPSVLRVIWCCMLMLRPAVMSSILPASGS